MHGSIRVCLVGFVVTTCHPQTRAETDPRAQNAYGIALQKQGRFEESLSYFRKALQLDPKYADAAYNFSLALLKVSRPAEALEVLEKHSFPIADHSALKGTALNALGRSADAVPFMRRAFELAPQNEDYAYDFVIVLLRVEKSVEAAAVLKKCRERFPRSAKMHAASGMLAYLSGRNAEAAREYEAATRLEPDAADLWGALGDVYAATDSFPAAGAAYSRAIKLDPKSPEYRVKAGRNLLKLRRTSEAEEAFRKAAGIDPADPETQFQLGKLAAARGDDTSAITHYERAIQSQPSMHSAWYQLSLSYRRTGQEEKSREALERFRKTQ